MKTYNPTLGANEVYIVAGGNAFVLILATSGVNVQYLKADLTDTNETATDVESGYFVNYPNKAFDLVKITNGSTPQTIKFGVARDGEGGYNIGASQIVGGHLDSIGEINQYQSYDGNRYYAGSSIIGVVGQFSQLMLNNPVTSTHDIILKSVIISPQANSDVGMLITTGGLLTNPSEIKNKLDDSTMPGSLGAASYGTSVAGITLRRRSMLAAYGTKQFINAEPIIIQPLKSIYIGCNTTGVSASVDLEFETKLR